MSVLTLAGSKASLRMRDEISTVSDDGARGAWISVGVPILGLMFVVIMLAVATLASFAAEADRGYATSSRRLVDSALDGRGLALASVALDYANWDQAYRAISDDWDPDWAEGNLYSSVADGMIVFRADGSIRYSWFADDVAALGPSIRPAAVDAARVTPGLRQLARAASPAATVTRTFARAGEHVFIVSVAPITEEDDAVRIANTAPRDYLALIDVMTPAEVTATGAALDLADMTLSARPSPPNEDSISATITAADGAEVGVLQWRHLHPGAAAFNRQIWPVIIGLLCVGGLAILVARLLVTRHMRIVADARAALDANTAKSEFLTRVGQELRTPLNAVIGYAELIQEENASLETRTDAGRIIAAARHLGHLINDIIDQARLDSGRVKLFAEVLPVAGVLAEVHGLIGPQAKAAGVELTTSSSALADFAFADHVRMRQCLLNLIGNAIKFSEVGGAVSVRARLEKGAGAAMVVFDVVDEGIGIAKGDLEHIFSPFGQANSAIAKAFGGTGLGLSVSRDLAREMGGDIRVVSELGKGSTFSLYLPAATGSALKVVA